MKDYYEILQVSPNAEPEVIAAAYRRLARKYHPDAYAEADATERMKELNEAYEVLGDPAKRAEYDRIRSHAKAGARWDEREDPRPPPSEEPPEPPKAAQRSKRGTTLVVSGLLGLVVLGVAIGIGVWLAMGAIDEDNGASPEGTGGSLMGVSLPAATPATVPTPDLSSFAKDWWRHGFGISIDANGVGTASWRVYKWCSDDPSPPCDAVVENRIISGGRATLVFDRVDGVTAFGRVSSSSDQLTLASGSEVLLTLLPYDMAMLRHNGYETTLCGPNFGGLAPKSVFETYPCGA